MASFKEELERTEFSFVTAADAARPKARRPFGRELGISDFSRADSRTENLMRDGGFRPGRTLDLHGFAIPDAYDKFIAFICANYDSQNRRLLIVTGKGSEGKGTGAIKREFRRWLNDPLACDKILAATPAAIAHGGSGAFYVLLRKK